MEVKYASKISKHLLFLCLVVRVHSEKRIVLKFKVVISSTTHILKKVYIKLLLLLVESSKKLKLVMKGRNKCYSFLKRDKNIQKQAVF